MKKANIFTENLAPGAAKRLGLGYDVVSGINPSINRSSRQRDILIFAGQGEDKAVPLIAGHLVKFQWCDANG